MTQAVVGLKYITKALDNRVLGLLDMLAEHDVSTFRHSLNVARYAALIGCELLLSGFDMNILVKSALLHDLGKVFVPSMILQKPARLTREEYQYVKNHPTVGADYLGTVLHHDLSEDELFIIENAVREHHENYDGSGYPQGLSGENISIFGRILRLADTFDAMVSERSYQGSVPSRVVAELISLDNGHFYDPNIVTKINLLV